MRGIGLVTAASLLSCTPALTGMRTMPGIPDAPGRPWVPKEPLDLPPVHPIAQTPELPEGMTFETLQQGVTLTLPQVLDIALRNNPATRVSWAEALQAAAEFGVSLAGWLPRLDLEIDLQHQKLAALGGRFDIEFSQVMTAVSLSWLVIDFGSRGGRVDSAAAALLAANLTHTRAIQALVLEVEEAYVQLVNAKALLEAQDVIVQAARTSLEAAQAREEAGVGTHADVLQARTALSRALLDRTTIVGQIDSLQGSLAASMGLPATIRVAVELLPPRLPPAEVTRAIEPLVNRALERRPDLAAARAQIAAEAGRVRQARSARLPSLGFAGLWNPSYFFNISSGRGLALQNYTIGLTLSVPLFDGFSTAYAEQSARAGQEAAQARADALGSQVLLDVWQAFVELGTAAAAMDSAADLLASARANFEVAQGRYREGVGSIIDLLNAQQALGTAQSSAVQARSGWFLAFARLSYATGGFLPDEPTARPLPERQQP